MLRCTCDFVIPYCQFFSTNENVNGLNQFSAIRNSFLICKKYFIAINIYAGFANKNWLITLRGWIFVSFADWTLERVQLCVHFTSKKFALFFFSLKTKSHKGWNQLFVKEVHTKQFWKNFILRRRYLKRFQRPFLMQFAIVCGQSAISAATQWWMDCGFTRCLKQSSHVVVIEAALISQISLKGKQ